MLMRRAMKPIEFTSIYIVSVNLESFMTVSIVRIQSSLSLSLFLCIENLRMHVLQVLKTSYSVFNLMQQSQES